MSEENFSCGSPVTTLAANGDRIMRAPHPKKMGAAASVADSAAYYTKPTEKSIAASSSDSQYVTLSATLQEVQARVSWSPKHLERLAGALIAVKRSGGDLGNTAMEFLGGIAAPAVTAVQTYIPAIDSLKKGWQRLVSFNEPDPIERQALQLVYEQSMSSRPAPHISQSYLHEIVAECRALAEEVKGAPPGSLLESMAKCLESMIECTNVPDEQIEAIRTLWRHLVASWVDLHWDKLETLPLNTGGREVFHTDMCDLWNRLVLLNRLIIHRKGQPRMPPIEQILDPHPFIAQIPPCLMDIPIYLRQSLGIDELEIQRSLLTSSAIIYKKHYPQRNLNDFKIWYKEQINIKHPKLSRNQEGWDFDDQLLEAVGDENNNAVGAYQIRNLRQSSETTSNASTRRTFQTMFGGSMKEFQMQRQIEDIPQTSELWEEVWRQTDTNPEFQTTVFDARALGMRLLADLKRLPAEEFVQQMIAVYSCMVYRDVVTVTLARAEELPKLQVLCLKFRELVEQGFSTNWSSACLEGIIEVLREFDRAVHGISGKAKSKKGAKLGAKSKANKVVAVDVKEQDEDDWTLVDVE